MLNSHNEFEALAGRVERGEAGAAAEMRRLLEGAMGPVVRRALRGGTSALERRIREAAHRVGWGEAGRGEVAAWTGASLSSRVVGRLRAGADSVRGGHATLVA
jgi:hypothetical protein